ncbi:hypothetical protein PMIN06_011915 [Paraphaeosphaeria minitans]
MFEFARRFLSSSRHKKHCLHARPYRQKLWRTTPARRQSCNHGANIATPIFIPRRRPDYSHSTSGIYSDGHKPASWNTLPSEIQQEILAPLVKFDCPISIISLPWPSKEIFPLLLVNKRMSAQTHYLYQKHNRFSLSHDRTSTKTLRGVPRSYIHSKVLKHPKDRLCDKITNLTLRFFPESICSVSGVQD